MLERLEVDARTRAEKRTPYTYAPPVVSETSTDDIVDERVVALGLANKASVNAKRAQEGRKPLG